MASAAVGLRPKRSKSNAFYGNAPHRGAGAQRLRGVPIGGSRKYGERSSRRTGVNLQYFRVEPTSLGSERGEQPLSRCGRGVSRGREGSRNTPLTLWPSGATPAAMPLAKAIGPAPRDCTLHGKHYKKHPPCGCTAGALKGSAGMLSGWCPCPQPGRRHSSQRPPRPSPGRGRSGAGPCWGCPGAC